MQFAPIESGTAPIESLTKIEKQLVVPVEKFEKVENDYAALKDRLVMEEFMFCNDAGDVCKKIVRDSVYRDFFPELHQLCCIALTIPLSTAWPERGFSTLARIKNPKRNRLSPPVLNALINVSTNGPKQLTDSNAIEIAKKWKDAKSRRAVKKRVIPSTSST